MGANIQVASDGVEALALWEAQSFDLALLDIEMPRKSGLELIRDIRRRNNQKSQKPIIALTAYVLAEHRRRIMETGADGIIAKPLMNIEAFGAEVAAYLDDEKAVSPVQHTGAPRTEANGLTPFTVPVDQQVFNALHETIGSDAFSELLGKLTEDLADVQRRLISGVAEQDISKIRSASHVLVSLAGAVGATPLQETAQHLNSAAHAGDFESIAKFQKTSLALLDELTVFLSETGALTVGV